MPLVDMIKLVMVFTSVLHCSQCYFLIPSLFSNLPPTIKFSNPSTPSAADVIPDYLKQYLYWAPATRYQDFYDSVTNVTGFKMVTPAKGKKSVTEEERVWLGKFGSTPLSSKTKILTKPYQKYNLLPGSNLLADKGNMAYHIKMTANTNNKRYAKEYNFTMLTFNYPSEQNLIKSTMKQHKDWLWIVKPVNQSLGRGIFLTTNYKELQKNVKLNQKYVVQRFLTNPYLTNITNRTVQIRIHVLVTNVNPLLLYISYETFVGLGLTKFNLTDPTLCGLIFTPLTVDACNIDISNIVDYFPIFARENFKPIVIKKIKSAANEIIIKTIATVLPKWEKLAQQQQFNTYNTFHMFSFDFMMDNQLKLYLNEINSLPLHSRVGVLFDCRGECDRFRPLVSRLNIAGINLPPTIPSKIRRKLCGEIEAAKDVGECIKSVGFNECLYKFPTSADLDLEAQGNNNVLPGNFTVNILKILVRAEDELNRSKLDNVFQRIYPSKGMKKYLKYMDKGSVNYNAALIMNDWEDKYSKNRKEGIKLLNQLWQQAGAGVCK